MALARPMQGSSSVNLESCSTELSQEDLLMSLILKACTGNPTLSPLTLDWKYPDGSTVQVNISEGLGTGINGTDVCDAPRIV